MLLWTVRSWTALVAICGTLSMLPVEADSGSHNIPPHLLECYRNQTLYHRENRLPATMPMVISLLEAIEESPGFTMDARSFALSLLHMFRVDGIERDPEVIASEHTTPFGLTGDQYYKHNVLLQTLIPRSSFLFPNETLNSVQKCSLHFLMSNSVDKVMRGDESRTCSSITGYSAQAPMQVQPGRRYRRDVTDDAAADEDDDVATDDAAVHAEDEGAANGDDLGTETASGEQATAAPPAARAAPAPAAGALDTAPDAASDAPDAAAPPAAEDPDAEVVLQSGEQGLPGNDGGAGPKKGDLRWDADGMGPSISGQMQVGPAGGLGRAQTYINSECPVENGVVFTRWGSVQLGTVLAGIATGFEPQLVAVKDIRAGSRSISGLSDTLTVDNRYAATLAGDLAEVAITRGPRNTVKIGASGNWNSTQAQHWYFIKETNQMTDAEIRGGLDGLIMAHHVKDWASKAEGALTLSAILERYYSLRGVFDEEYRACERQNHYKNVAQSDTLREQTTSFASALYDATPSTPMITSVGLSDYATDAVEALDKTVPTQMETNCQVSTRQEKGTENIVPKLNVMFVVDCQWSYNQINPILQSVAENIHLHPMRSQITVIGGTTHEVLFNTTDRLFEFSENLNQNATKYVQCSQGMKLKDLLNIYLRNYFTYQLENEKNSQESTVRSNVVILMPYLSYDIPTAEIREVENLVNEYRKYFPDVMFLFFVSQRKDSFKVLVEDYDKDVVEFLYTSGSSNIDTLDLINRLRTVPRRIANPSCGTKWQTGNYNQVRIYETTPSKQIAVYRIHPKYLFGIGSETIKIREQDKGTVTVCYSRTDETPQDDDDSDEDKDDSQCESLSGTQVEIKLNNPCSGSSSYLTCNPLYISIEATESKYRCLEKTCRTFDDGAVEIIHNNLTCGVAGLRNSITFAVTAILIISKILVSG